MREREKKGNRMMLVRVEYENVEREDEWNDSYWSVEGSEKEFHDTYEGFYPKEEVN